jgi:hypothetical protein
MTALQGSGVELVLSGVAALAALSMVVRVWAAVRRARVMAAIARAGASPVSLFGHVLVTAGLIVGAQLLVITYAAGDLTWLLVVLAFPALIAAYTLTRALTVIKIGPIRRTGGRR